MILFLLIFNFTNAVIPTLHGLDEKLNKLQWKIDDIEPKVKNLEEANHDLKWKVKHLEEEVRNLKEKNHDLESEVKILKQINHEMESQIGPKGPKVSGGFGGSGTIDKIEPITAWQFDTNFNCWADCNQKGGQCDVCNQGAIIGYCCRPDGFGGNGDCPSEVVLSISPLKNMHHCFFRP